MYLPDYLKYFGSGDTMTANKIIFKHGLKGGNK